MKPFRKALAVLALGAASTAAWFGVTNLVQNVQFARAQEQVELSRQQLQTTQDLSGAFRQVAKVVEPSVVKIDVKKTIRNARRQMMDPDLLRRFFPDRDGDGQPDIPDLGDEDSGGTLAMGEGSGVIMEVDGGTGYILTNNHVAGDASEMRITLSDGREIIDAKLVGTDPKSDLAVIKFEAERLIPAKWGNSDYLEKGDWILAFGSPFGYVGSMTHGVVSALNRDRVGIINSEFSYENFIQVDAPINPGNSGGPLVNLRGEVVGVNTAIASRTGSFNGIGFAIPSNMAKPIYEQLKDKGKVVRGWLGVEVGSVGEARLREMIKASGYTGDTGAFVSRVVNDTPSSGKLQPGDVITAINGKKVENSVVLRNQIAATAPGTDVKLAVVRNGKPKDITIRIGEQPQDLLSRVTGRNGNRNGEKDAETTGSAESLGVRLITPTEQQLQRYNLGDQSGALVTNVAQGSPAAMAGIRPGDLITKVGDKTVTNAEEVTEALGKLDTTKGLPLYITNKDGERFVFVKATK
jgi:serine protease Do